MDIIFLELFIMQRILCFLISALNIKFRYHLAIWEIGEKGWKQYSRNSVDLNERWKSGGTAVGELAPTALMIHNSGPLSCEALDVFAKFSVKTSPDELGCDGSCARQ